jgi:hypothetical protein
VPSPQPLSPAPGLVLTDTLARTGLVDLADVVAVRHAVDARA